MSPTQVIPDNTENLQLFYILNNGSVVLNGSLDYAKNTFYQIKILAQVRTIQAGGAGLPGKGAVGLTGALLLRMAGDYCTTTGLSRRALLTCP